MDWHGKQKAVTFSYDDGVGQDERLIELFQRYGMQATFNLNAQLLYEDSHWENRGVAIRRLDAPRAQALYAPFEVAAHTLTHPHPRELSDEALRREIAEDKRMLEDLFPAQGGVRGMAYPYGEYDERIVRTVHACGLRYARTVHSTRRFSVAQDLLRLPATCHHNDGELFTLVDAFLRSTPERPMLLYIWGHSYEFDVDNNWDRMEELCRALGGREEIFYCTNAQALLD